MSLNQGKRSPIAGLELAGYYIGQHIHPADSVGCPYLI